MNQQRRRFEPGTTISGTNYKIIRFIGSGAMGAVYEVLHRELDKVFVIKVLHQDLVEQDDPVRRLRCEWRLLARLDHPNIVSVIDAGMTREKVPFFVMERLEGETLLSRINREPRWPVSDAVCLAMELLDALVAAHSIGIVHRDIKPSNIFLAHKGGVKLIDFGIAKMFGTNATVTARGVTLGTPRYMAPEQACGKVADFRSDLYALGVILFEIIAGEHPFVNAQTPVEMLIAQAGWEAPALPSDRLGVTKELVALVAKLLSKNPANRPSSAVSVRESVRRISSEVMSMQKNIKCSCFRRDVSREMDPAASTNALKLSLFSRVSSCEGSGNIGMTVGNGQGASVRRGREPFGRNRMVLHVGITLLLATVALSASSFATSFPISRILSSVWFSGCGSVARLATTSVNCWAKPREHLNSSDRKPPLSRRAANSMRVQQMGNAALIANDAKETSSRKCRNTDEACRLDADEDERKSQ